MLTPRTLDIRHQPQNSSLPHVALTIIQRLTQHSTCSINAHLLDLSQTCPEKLINSSHTVMQHNVESAGANTKNTALTPLSAVPFDSQVTRHIQHLPTITLLCTNMDFMADTQRHSFRSGFILLGGNCDKSSLAAELRQDMEPPLLLDSETFTIASFKVPLSPSSTFLSTPPCHNTSHVFWFPKSHQYFTWCS